jgi:hypothetical protein
MGDGGVVRFQKGSRYTRGQIHEAVGGSLRAALPARGGRVVCACLTFEKNPRAPEEMVVGTGERAVRLARAFAASGEAVPVFVRTRRGDWEYTGERRVRSVIEDPGALLALAAAGASPDLSLALRLEEAVGASPDTGGAPLAPRQSPTAAGA